DGANDHARLTTLLQSFASDAATGPLLANAPLLDRLCEGDDLPAIVERIAALSSDDPWLQAAQKTLAAGAPGSARLAFELQRRAAGLSLAEVYRLEYVAALHCAAHGDFAEGIRALLVDKDRTPRWQPRTLAEATEAWADAFFVSPWPAGQHPLADLDATNAERTFAWAAVLSWDWATWVPRWPPTWPGPATSGAYSTWCPRPCRPPSMPAPPPPAPRG